jgi:hypothetical protein
MNDRATDELESIYTEAIVDEFKYYPGLEIIRKPM